LVYEIRKGDMNGICSTLESDGKMTQILVEYLKGIAHMGEVSVHKRMIVEYMLKE
jgi:hypothetical protein